MARKNFEYGDTLTAEDLEAAFVGLETSDAKNFHVQTDWSAVTPYQPNDVVWSGSATWMALLANTNSMPASGNANWRTLGTAVVAATATTLGTVKMSVAPVVAASPVAVGDNDPRLPAQPFTEAIQDAIAAFFVAGSGISFLYDDSANTFRVTNSAPLDVEAVQDVVGAMTQSGANVTSTYDDAAGTLTIASSGSSTLTGEDVQDIVAGLLTAGTNVALSYNDAANTLTVTASGGNNTPATLFVDTEADIPANTPNGTLIVVANSTLPAPSGGGSNISNTGGSVSVDTGGRTTIQTTVNQATEQVQIQNFTNARLVTFGNDGNLQRRGQICVYGVDGPNFERVRIVHPGDNNNGILLLSEAGGTGVVRDFNFNANVNLSGFRLRAADLNAFAGFNQASEVSFGENNVAFKGGIGFLPGSLDLIFALGNTSITNSTEFMRLTSAGDLKITRPQNGVVMKDRTTGTDYRLKMDNGVLGVEAI